MGGRQGPPAKAVTRTWLAAVIMTLPAIVAAQAGTLSVQLIEPGYLPVPTVSIKVTQVTSCRPSTAAPAPSAGETKMTDKTGTATFEVRGKGFYLIEVPSQDGYSGERRCIELSDFARFFPTAYVQIPLKPAGTGVTVR